MCLVCKDPDADYSSTLQFTFHIFMNEWNQLFCQWLSTPVCFTNVSNQCHHQVPPVIAVSCDPFSNSCVCHLWYRYFPSLYFLQILLNTIHAACSELPDDLLCLGLIQMSATQLSYHLCTGCLFPSILYRLSHVVSIHDSLQASHTCLEVIFVAAQFSIWTVSLLTIFTTRKCGVVMFSVAQVCLCVSVCPAVCLSCNFWKPGPRKFIFGLPVHPQNIQVEFVCQGNGSKKAHLCNLLTGGPPSIERQSCYVLPLALNVTFSYHTINH